jgi:N-acetylmuramoyl-L-alanine amidase
MVPYYVLRNTAMPAVLVELGFLSDFEEAIILSSPVHQEAMGISIAQSVGEFFSEENG